MVPALLATLGHKSAHSFPIGPVIADPFISPLGFTITPALSENNKKKIVLILFVLTLVSKKKNITMFCNIIYLQNK
jgi:hypothetical protein